MGGISFNRFTPPTQLAVDKIAANYRLVIVRFMFALLRATLHAFEKCEFGHVSLAYRIKQIAEGRYQFVNGL